MESIVREKFPTGLDLDHLYTGVRGVYINIEKGIPPSLEISGWKVRIFYEGLRNKCFSCGLDGHLRDNCPDRKMKKTKEKKNGKPVSYAGIVESGAGVAELSEEVEIIEEEIIEEEVVNLQPEERIVELQKIEQKRKEEQQEEEEAEQRRLKQEKQLAGIAKLANAFQAAMDRHDANERRNKFAATASSSTEVLRPKKTARKS